MYSALDLLSVEDATDKFDVILTVHRR